MLANPCASMLAVAALFAVVFYASEVRVTPRASDRAFYAERKYRTSQANIQILPFVNYVNPCH